MFAYRSVFRCRLVLLAISVILVLMVLYKLLRDAWLGSELNIKVRLWSVKYDDDPWLRSDPSEVYSAAIVYLASYERSKELVLSLSYVFANLPMAPWPIIIFHTGDFRSAVSQMNFKRNLYKYLLSSSDMSSSYAFVERLEFHEIEWTFPTEFNYSLDDLKPYFARVWPGYHHMIYFYAFKIFQHPRLKDTTYYLRLDTDSYIYSKACYDPFQRMHERNLSYAYRIENLEPATYVQGLADLVDWYSVENRDVAQRIAHNNWVLPPVDDRSVADMRQYYNNFEVVRLSAFLRPDVQAWLEELASDPKRIYKWRWGDAPIRFATVNMFLDVESEVEMFCGVPYRHFESRGIDCGCD